MASGILIFTPPVQRIMQKEAGIPKKSIKVEDIPGLSKYQFSNLSLSYNVSLVGCLWVELCIPYHCFIMYWLY